MFYILKGKKTIQIDYEDWVLSSKITTIKRTPFINGMIWTLFLGLDHNISGVGEPELFESIICGGILDGKQYVYTTWDHAIKGHEYLLKKILQQTLELN